MVRQWNIKHKFYTHHFLSSKIKNRQITYNNNKYCWKLNLSHQIRISNREKKSDASFNLTSKIWRHMLLVTAGTILFLTLVFLLKMHYTNLEIVWQLILLSEVILSSCVPHELQSIRNQNSNLYHIFLFDQF